MRPPGSVTSAGFVSLVVATSLSTRSTTRAAITAMRIFQPRLMAAVTLAGTHGEIRHPRRDAALRRGHRCGQQERRPADPRRLPSDRGGAAPAQGSADPRHRGPDRAARAPRGRGGLGGGQQPPPQRPKRDRGRGRPRPLEQHPRLLPRRRAAAGALRRGEDAAAGGRLHRPPPARRPPRRLRRPRRPGRGRPLDRADLAQRRTPPLRDLHGRALGDGHRERPDGGGADARARRRSPTPPASPTSRTSRACSPRWERPSTGSART